MVGCALADSGLPKFMSGIDVHGGVLGNRAPHYEIGLQSLCIVLHETELDLRLLRIIGAWAFKLIETYSKQLELRAVE